MSSEGEPDGGDHVFYSSTIFDRTLEEKLTAAAAGGFTAIGLWASDRYRAHRAGLTDGDIRALLNEHQLAVAGIDCMFGWAGGENLPPDAVFSLSKEMMIESALALGAPSINLAHAFGKNIDDSIAVDRFAEICACAAAANLLVTLEPIPWAGIPTVASACRILAQSHAPNARLMIDVWHFFRGGGATADLPNIPVSLIGGIQFCDAWLDAGDDPWTDTSDRQLPMEGGLPVIDFARRLHSMGYDGLIGIECPSQQWAGMAAASIGARCGKSMRDLRSAVGSYDAADTSVDQTSRGTSTS